MAECKQACPERFDRADASPSVEARLWHPVAQAHDVGAAPLAVQLLGRAVVLWRDRSKAVHAWADQCPHRGAKFSLGQVYDGHLECPYHGWQFDASGQCTKVPAVPDFVPPPSHRAQVFEAQERYGLVWVRMAAGDADAAHAGVPHFEAEHDGRLRKLNCGPYDVLTSAPRIVENFLDMAHFGFVHAGWLGSRQHTGVADYTVAGTPTGLVATGCKAWQPHSNLHSTAPAQVEYRYEVTAPYAALLSKVPDAASTALAGYRESIALFICPVTQQSSRVWFRLAVADFTSPDTHLQAFQHPIFLQDQPVLESQHPKCLPLDGRSELHTAADRASSAYRRFLQRSGIRFGVLGHSGEPPTCPP
jgi:phenylpropionate dioxygenase-like ring-hydroxylating dioxygenase large terminal subunit